MVQCTHCPRRLTKILQTSGSRVGRNAVHSLFPLQTINLNKPLRISKHLFALGSGPHSPGAHLPGAGGGCEGVGGFSPARCTFLPGRIGRCSASFTVEWFPLGEREEVSSPPSSLSFLPTSPRSPAGVGNGSDVCCMESSEDRLRGPGSLLAVLPPPSVPGSDLSARGAKKWRRLRPTALFWASKRNGRGRGTGEVRGALGAPWRRLELPVLFLPLSSSAPCLGADTLLSPAQRMNGREKQFPPPPPHFRSLRASVTSAQQFH
ncbi:uncharacterized protein LOC108303421 [Cebus imitator]|uniref:uncharacterized protein LOC108303421 n=1 Tax=Cebus imitator TaxID=2715852 RepID=UPI00080A4755|nr:uncharacterized protein LOC108303421 [Cebus imitator]